MIRNGRRTLAALLALIMVLVLLPTVSAQADSEIEIADYEQLKAFAARVNGGETRLNAKLTEDITCTDKTWTPIGTDNERYNGTFNGQGHTITGLSNADVDYSGLSDYDEVYIGLFGVVEDGTVQNVVIEDCALSFASDADVEICMGAVVGRNDRGTVEGCSVSGTVSGSKNGSNTLAIGGVAGINYHSVRNCRNTGAVSVYGNCNSVYCGGVVGDSGGGSEQYCVNTGAVTSEGIAWVGGVTGNGKSVKNCLNTGTVSGGNCRVGGIVGYTAYGTIENCLNVGAVSDGVYSGGIVGQNAYGAVKTCLSVGAVSGDNYVGGVVGHCPYAASPNFCVENCYCLYTEAYDPIGNEGAATVTNVAALTAEQLKSLSNCVGFSTDTWYEGLSYPVLKNLSGEVHLYANSNEDLVLQRFICAYAPTKIANPFTYANHEFTGWNTDPDGDGDPYDETHAFTLLPGETLALCAQWRDAVLEIANYEQLKAFAERVNGGEYGLNAKITSDFTCPTAADWTPICPESEHGYTGTFNGNNCVITGLKFNQTITSDAAQLQRWYIGLFGVIGTGGTVQDLYLKDCSIQVSVSAPYFNLYEGAVAGRNFGTITACGVFGEGEISGVRTGGDKSANAFVGGIAGYNNGIITDSCFIGTVNVQSNASSKGFSPAEVGGIAGRNPSSGNRTAIENCFHSGSVIASGGDFVQTSVGGIVGTNYAELRNCRHNGSVQGAESKSHLYNSIGGVAGTNGVQGIITYCYARSAVEDLEGGSGLLYLGGVVGANTGGSTSDCFCDTTLAPDTEVIGFVGSGSFSDVVGLASEAFADESNFSGWENFDMNWVMGVDQPEVKALSAPVRLYANSNEDVVILNNIPVCTPVKFANPFTYANHEFTGWNTQADGEGDPYDETHEFTLLPGETLSLSAQWKTNAFMIMFQNEDGTPLQSGPVAVGETPVYEGETPTKAPTVEHLYTFAGWKLLGTETVLTELPAVDGEATYVAAYTESDRVYTGPVWAWDGYESATATFTATDDTSFTQVLTAEGDAITHMTTVEPDCEYPGVETYTAKVTFLGKDYFNDKTKEIAKRDHIWVFDEFVWTPNEQGIYTVVANFHCERYASHKLEFIPVAGIATDPATCTEDGCTHYVAYIHPMESPDGLEHEDKLDIVIPAHGHQWSAPDYERIETETGYDVYAIVRCYYDYSHRIEETVHATFEVITPPTLYEEGLGRYTADFEDEHLWDIQWEVVIPKLALGLYGEDVNAFDVAEYTEDGTLYRYDIKLRNDAGILPIASLQMFLDYDADALTFVKAETVLPNAGSVRDTDGVLAFAWATDGEGVQMESGTVVLSLYFALNGAVQDGDVCAFRFTEQNDFVNSVSYLENGETVEAVAFETIDGSMTFAVPELTIAGEDVLSGDVYVKENGGLLYRYEIRVKDLPAAGLPVNSMQIFVNFDHAVLAVARTEGPVDWTVSESGDTFMAVWASDGNVLLSEDEVVLTLWFEKIGPAPEDSVVPITFTENLLGNESAASITFAGTVTELVTNTVDGSITFEEVVYGDANCDGQVTAADAAMILRAIVGLSELSSRGVLNADVDGDGEVTAADAAVILRYVVGLIDTLPA